MLTITGKLEDSSGNALHRSIVIQSLSTPQVGNAGLVTGNTTETLMTDPSTGEFSVQLQPGLYAVSYKTTPKSTDFQIAVVATDGSTSIDLLVITALPTLPGQAPYLVWNGDRPGNITFQPADDPGAPVITVIAYAGSHIAAETYTYAISYITPDGETAMSGTTVVVGDGTADKANAVALDVSPTRVTSKRVWRTSSDGTGNLYLLAEVAPTVASYWDWESLADFDVRKDASIVAPQYNTTAGVIYAAAGQEALLVSLSGLKTEALLQVAASCWLTSELMVEAAGGISFRNPTATANYATLSTPGKMSYVPPIGAALEIFHVGVNLGGTAGQFWIMAGELYFPQGAAAGYVLTSDVDGKANWQAAAGGAAAISIGGASAPSAPPTNQAVISFAVGDAGTFFYWNPTTLAWVAVVS